MNASATHLAVTIIGGLSLIFPPPATPPQRFIVFLFDDLHLSASDLV
jgi:hypothetical protein